MATCAWARTKEAGVRDPEPAYRPVPEVPAIGRMARSEEVFQGQWMADSPKAILVYLLEHNEQVWVPLRYFRSDDMGMPGEAGFFTVPGWLARKWLDSGPL